MSFVGENREGGSKLLLTEERNIFDRTVRVRPISAAIIFTYEQQPYDPQCPIMSGALTYTGLYRAHLYTYTDCVVVYVYWPCTSTQALIRPYDNVSLSSVVNTASHEDTLHTNIVTEN